MGTVRVGPAHGVGQVAGADRLRPSPMHADGFVKGGARHRRRPGPLSERRETRSAAGHQTRRKVGWFISGRGERAAARRPFQRESPFGATISAESATEAKRAPGPTCLGSHAPRGQRAIGDATIRRGLGPDEVIERAFRLPLLPRVSVGPRHGATRTLAPSGGASGVQ